MANMADGTHGPAQACTRLLCAAMDAHAFMRNTQCWLRLSCCWWGADETRDGLIAYLIWVLYIVKQQETERLMSRLLVRFVLRGSLTPGGSLLLTEYREQGF